jgi:hypothetical protein
MSKQEWWDQIIPLISWTARLANVAQNHPAYRAACAKIDRLIEQGLEYEYITKGEAVAL